MRDHVLVSIDVGVGRDKDHHEEQIGHTEVLTNLALLL